MAQATQTNMYSLIDMIQQWLLTLLTFVGNQWEKEDLECQFQWIFNIQMIQLLWHLEAQPIKTRVINLGVFRILVFMFSDEVSDLILMTYRYYT